MTDATAQPGIPKTAKVVEADAPTLQKSLLSLSGKGFRKLTADIDVSSAGRVILSLAPAGDPGAATQYVVEGDKLAVFTE